MCVHIDVCSRQTEESCQRVLFIPWIVKEWCLHVFLLVFQFHVTVITFLFCIAGEEVKTQ